MAHTTSNTAQIVPAWAAPEAPPAGTPAWLPEGVVTYGDFANGHFYMGGEEVAVADVLDDDEDNSVVFNPAAITAQGYESSTPDILGGKFTGAALASLADPAGATVVVELDYGASCTFVYEAYADDYSTDYWISVSDAQVQVRDFNGDLNNTSLPAAVAGLNRIAFTHVPGTRLSLSINGETAVSGSATLGGAISHIYFRMGAVDDGMTIKSISVRPAVADAALPALSAL